MVEVGEGRVEEGGDTAPEISTLQLVDLLKEQHGESSGKSSEQTSSARLQTSPQST